MSVDVQTGDRSTKRQKELLSFVDGFIQGHGYGPSYREIMRALGYKSVSTVAIHIDNLIVKGYLVKRDRSARSLEVVSTKFTGKDIAKTATPAQEKWLVTAITDRFIAYKARPTNETLDELYVLIAALKVLGLGSAHEAMKTKLLDIRR